MTQFHGNVVEQGLWLHRNFQPFRLVRSCKGLLVAQPSNRAPFSVVGIQECLGRFPDDDHDQPPRQVSDIVDAGVSAEAASGRRQLMGCVACKKLQTLAAFRRDATGHRPVARHDYFESEVLDQAGPNERFEPLRAQVPPVRAHRRPAPVSVAGQEDAQPGLLDFELLKAALKELASFRAAEHDTIFRSQMSDLPSPSMIDGDAWTGWWSTNK